MRSHFFTNLRSTFFTIVKGLDIIFGLNKNQLTVLAYHGISNNSDFYSISLKEFKKQIKQINKTSEFVSITEIEKILKGKKSIGNKVVLTIDDGYKNVLEIASFLKEENIPATLFVLSNPTHANRKEINNSQEFLSIKQIKSLKKLGWTIGSHSATHSDFYNLTKKQIESEVINSKLNLEKKLGFKIEYFAYPKGRFTKEILDVVSKVKYKAAFSTTPGSVNFKTSKFIIPRIVINKSYQVFDFPAAFSPITFFLRNKFSNLLSKVYE